MFHLGFVRELGAAERIYCREQIDHGNQTLVQVLVIANTCRISETNARQALLTLHREYFPILGYEICSSNDRCTSIYKSKDIKQTEHDLMLHFKYEQVIEFDSTNEQCQVFA
jgi:hypothetical protein